MEEISRILLFVTQFAYLVIGIPAIIVWWNSKEQKEAVLTGIVWIILYILNAIDLFRMFVI